MNVQQKTHRQEAATNAKFSVPKKTPDMVSRTKQVATVIKGTPLWQNQSLQQSVVGWLAAADVIDQLDQSIKTARLNLAGLLAQRVKGVTAWKRATKAVVTDVDAVAAGSSQVITQLGFELSVRQPTPPSVAPPTGLVAKYTRALVLVLKWKAVKGSRGYAVQIGDAAGQSWGPVLTSVKSSYEPQGLAPGQKVSVRVAVHRPSGTSDWSDALFVTVR